MGQTIIEKILSNHSDKAAQPGDIVDVRIDTRIARDFGGANVVKNIRENRLPIDDPARTFFTFDCNPGGSDQKYAENQQICRQFARENGIRVYDIDAGIGTHIAIDEGLILPGGTLVSTDSHANILGAVGAFGQGMGDQDIAAAWAHGRVWFKVPASIKVDITGKPPAGTQAKDIVLLLLSRFGASGLLGLSAEFYGEAVDALGLSERITIASMATEMAGIIALFPPNSSVIDYFEKMGRRFEPAFADDDAVYEQTVEIDVSGLVPLLSRPGHPEDVVPVAEAAGTKIDSVFIGSCTNGRYEDMVTTAGILKGRKVAPGVVLKIVPTTRRIWQRCLEDGLLDIFMKAGALVGNPGCAGCAAGQIGQNGPGEITVSTGNRNFAGKQGKGSVYLASPATAAASAMAGIITTAGDIPKEPVLFVPAEASPRTLATESESSEKAADKPILIKGRIWVIDRDNVDTDMIFHNRHLTITNIDEMGKHALGNLEGWEDFSVKAKPGDILVTGNNFGAGSSRQQAVDCFRSLRVQALIAKSFGAIYERNAVNAGLPILTGDLISAGLESGEEITVDLAKGEIIRHKTGEKLSVSPFSEVQMEIYQRGGLLK